MTQRKTYPTFPIHKDFSMMTSRERVQIALHNGIPDRVPYQDVFWATTIERWRTEGLPAGVNPYDHFGCEMARLSADYTLQMPVETIEQTGHHHVYRDANGATRKDLNTADGWTPGWIDFAIRNRDDWFRLKKRGQFHPSRIPANIRQAFDAARAKDRFVSFSVHACFHPTWHKIGLDTMLVWMIEDPDLVTDMFATHTQLIIDMYEALRAQGIAFDGAWLSDDLGYRNAPLISPAMYKSLVLPHHQKLCRRFAQDGLKTILHSDGNVEPLIPLFLDAGFAALHPLEAKVDALDVRKLKPAWGDRLVLFGNIDVRKLAGTREEVEEEIRTKVGQGKIGGGYLFHSDHSVPNDVSLDNYRFALDMLKKYGSY